MDNNLRVRMIGRRDGHSRPGAAGARQDGRHERRQHAACGSTWRSTTAAAPSWSTPCGRSARRSPRADSTPGEVDEEAIASRLYTAGLDDPDLLVRTAGEMRISNFLLWQISYAEIWVTDRCWPEFDEPTLHEAIRDFANRNRKFGGLAATKRRAELTNVLRWRLILGVGARRGARRAVLARCAGRPAGRLSGAAGDRRGGARGGRNAADVPRPRRRRRRRGRSTSACCCRWRRACAAVIWHDRPEVLAVGRLGWLALGLAAGLIVAFARRDAAVRGAGAVDRQRRPGRARGALRRRAAWACSCNCGWSAIMPATIKRLARLVAAAVDDRHGQAQRHRPVRRRPHVRQAQAGAADQPRQDVGRRRRRHRASPR